MSSLLFIPMFDMLRVPWAAKPLSVEMRKLEAFRTKMEVGVLCVLEVEDCDALVILTK